MAYHSNWQSLSDAAKRVVALTACSQVEAETDICRAIADGAINLRGKLKRRQSTNQTAVGATLERTAFQIPTDIGRSDLDWEKSCPLKPWIVRRGHFELPGPWELEWIKLFWPDIQDTLCNSRRNAQVIRPPESGPAVAGKTLPTLVKTETPIALGSEPTEGLQRPAGSARRRGPPPKKLERVKEAMRNDIGQRQLSLAELDGMLEKTLAQRYGVSRDTARKARMAVVSEFRIRSIPRQIPTNDK